MQVGAHGETSFVQNSIEELAKGESEGANFCNNFYWLGDQNQNECDSTKGKKVDSEAHCVWAATAPNLPGYSKADLNFTVNNGLLSPLPWPKECFAEGGKVYWNPTAPSPTGEGESLWQGYPVCVRDLYPKVNSTQTWTCPDGWEEISTIAECITAAECVLGDAGCQEQELQNNLGISLNDRPNGCFAQPLTGCFNFNNANAASNKANWEGKKICKRDITGRSTANYAD